MKPETLAPVVSVRYFPTTPLAFANPLAWRRQDQAPETLCDHAGDVARQSPAVQALVVTYLWIKALHVLAVITWMAGIFYIFRLFGYHTRHRKEPSTVAVFREMEWKMLRIVMLPGALASIALGVTMLV